MLNDIAALKKIECASKLGLKCKTTAWYLDKVTNRMCCNFTLVWSDPQRYQLLGYEVHYV